MNESSIISGKHNGQVALAFDYLLTEKRSRRHRQEPLLRVLIKLMAFAMGCLIAMAFGLYGEPDRAQERATHAPSTTIFSHTAE